ncbi:uncharacterized protein [Panulirus ornatus]|uniref:uncharacterized protein n=1 Tax=Panulirus ornatus TaxID=150431 RepID=UPI003A84DF46
MYPSLALMACLACVTAYPAVFLPYEDEKGGTNAASLLDCTQSSDGSYRCRPVRHRNPNKTPGPERVHVLEMIEEGQNRMTVLEIMEESRDGMTVLEIAEEIFPSLSKRQQEDETDEVDPSFVITVPEQSDHKALECGPHQIYVPEIDICEDLADHSGPSKAPLVSDSVEPFKIMSVGHFEEEECPEGQMMVFEIGICLDVNPPEPI